MSPICVFKKKPAPLWHLVAHEFCQKQLEFNSTTSGSEGEFNHTCYKIDELQKKI